MAESAAPVRGNHVADQFSSANRKPFNETEGSQDETTTKKQQTRAPTQQTNGTDREEFRCSNENTANEAGRFQVNQQPVFTVAATVLLVENGGGQNQQQVPAAALATTVNAAVTAAPSTKTAAPTGNAQVLSELQNLNAWLIALGLSQDEINVIDRVAQLIKDFSLAAFTSLVSQLKALAETSGQTAQIQVSQTAAATARENGCGVKAGNKSFHKDG